jgi:hypothetical protein
MSGSDEEHRKLRRPAVEPIRDLCGRPSMRCVDRVFADTADAFLNGLPMLPGIAPSRLFRVAYAAVRWKFASPHSRGHGQHAISEW